MSWVKRAYVSVFFLALLVLLHLFLVVVAEVFEVSSAEATSFEVVQAVVRVRHLRGRVGGRLEARLGLLGEVRYRLDGRLAADVGRAGLLACPVVALFVASRVLVFAGPGPLGDFLDFLLGGHHGLRRVFLYVARGLLAACEVARREVRGVLVQAQARADLVSLGLAHGRVPLFVLLDFREACFDGFFVFLELGLVCLDLFFERGLLWDRGGGESRSWDCAGGALDGSSDEFLDDGGEERFGGVCVADVEFVDWVSSGYRGPVFRWWLCSWLRGRRRCR
jgi:hypothetical protein